MANNCNDYFEQLRQKEEENKALRDELKRLVRKTGATTGEEQARRTVAWRGAGGRLFELGDDEVRAMMKQAAERMSDPELGDLVLRSIDQQARPVGADGRFENYRRLLAQLGDMAQADDWGSVMETLFQTWEQMLPDDFAFITRVFDQEQAAALARTLRSQFDGSEQEAGAAILRAIQENAVGFTGLAERKVRMRFMADLSMHNYVDAINTAADALDAVPGQPLPAELRRQLFGSYKVLMLAQRQDKYANRQLGQALRSQQFELEDVQRLQMGSAEAAEALKMKAADVQGDSHFARVMEAIDQGPDGVDTLRELAKTVTLDSIDPTRSIEDGWQNPLLRYSIALAKDSQLTSVRPQLISNTLGNLGMNIYGRLRTWMENIGYLHHNGASWGRALSEGTETAWNAHRVSMDMTRAAARDLMSDAFHSGKNLYGGNEDFPNHNRTYNEELLQKVQDTFNQPILARGPDGEALAQPQLLARMVGKLQAGPRLLLFEKTGRQHHWLLTPAFRGMAAVDNTFGHHAYVFGTRNNLELRARAGDATPEELLRDKSQADRLPTVDEEGNVQQNLEPLGPDDFYDLSNPKDRQEWIDRELGDSFQKLQPTEQEVKAYRRQHGLNGSDLSDDEIKKILALRNAGDTYTGPSISNRSAQVGWDYNQWTRMQHEQTGALGQIDAAVMQARRHWAVDALVPYWRAPFNAFLFDTTLGFPPMARTLELWGKARRIEGGWQALPAEEVAKVQAGWATSGMILGLFAGLDAAGLIVGNGPMDPQQRREWQLRLKGKPANSIAGIPLSGLPVLNTLFLWKDLKDAAAAGALSQFDRITFEAIPQVLTSQLVRQTGFAQLKQLLDVLNDPQRNASNFAAFMGSGLAIPFVGLERTAQFTTGSGPRDFYQPGRSGSQEWRLPPDDPFEKLRESLNNLLYKVTPGAWSTMSWMAGLVPGADPGDRRITEDWLGTSIRFPYGTPIDVLDQQPGFPQAWPPGDDKLYGELDAQDRLVPPTPLLVRELDGVKMPPELLKEYNRLYSTTKGELPLSARMQMGNRSVTVSFPLQFDVNVIAGGKGVHLKTGETAKVELGPFLDKHVRGRTVQGALRSLINDPLYQAMQDSPELSNDPRVRDMPPAERRKRAASVMIQGIKDYYALLAQDRLWASSSPAAREWQDKRRGVAELIRKDSLDGIKALPQAINGRSQ